MLTFDFDYWRDLASTDPTAFFRERRRLIDFFIDIHPVPQACRLREFQRQIDCVRANAGTPMGAARELAAMIDGQLENLRGQAEDLRRASERLSRVLYRPGARERGGYCRRATDH